MHQHETCSPQGLAHRQPEHDGLLEMRVLLTGRTICADTPDARAAQSRMNPRRIPSGSAP